MPSTAETIVTRRDGGQADVETYAPPDHGADREAGAGRGEQPAEDHADRGARDALQEPLDDDDAHDQAPADADGAEHPDVASALGDDGAERVEEMNAPMNSARAANTFMRSEPVAVPRTGPTRWTASRG